MDYDSKNVISLIEKATRSQSSLEALQYSQAALNASNALLNLASTVSNIAPEEGI